MPWRFIIWEFCCLEDSTSWNLDALKIQHLRILVPWRSLSENFGALKIQQLGLSEFLRFETLKCSFEDYLESLWIEDVTFWILVVLKIQQLTLCLEDLTSGHLCVLEFWGFEVLVSQCIWILLSRTLKSWRLQDFDSWCLEFFGVFGVLKSWCPDGLRSLCSRVLNSWYLSVFFFFFFEEPF